MNSISLLIRDLNAEFFLDGHDYFHCIQTIESQVVLEMCCAGDLHPRYQQRPKGGEALVLCTFVASVTCSFVSPDRVPLGELNIPYRSSSIDPLFGLGLLLLRGMRELSSILCFSEQMSGRCALTVVGSWRSEVGVMIVDGWLAFSWPRTTLGPLLRASW
jgi:hypothetical protein